MCVHRYLDFEKRRHKVTFKIFICILGLFFATISQAGQLKPFKSDGCSAFPDGSLQQKQLWLSCCTVHDFAYWKGGTYDERLSADQALKKCVEKIGKPKVAALMLAGVRVGGTPYLPTTFRWGYGWTYPRLYNPLSEKEVQQVINITGNDITK